MVSLRIFYLVRIMLWLLPVGLFLWIINQNLAPLGSLTLTCTAVHCDPRIDNFASKEKEILTGTSKQSGEQYRVITADPLYFDANLMRPFNRATVTMTYQNPQNQPRLLVGVQGKGTGYEFYPLVDNPPFLDLLSDEWRTVREGDRVLYERKADGVREFDSVEDFLADLPNDMKRIATYREDLSASLPIVGYTPAVSGTRIPARVRGSHTLQVYVGKNEPLDVRMTIQTINRHAGKDPVTVRVYRGNEKIHEEVIPDDGDGRATGIPSEPHPYALILSDVPQGTYRIEFVSQTDDPFFDHLTSRAHLVMLDRTLYLAGDREYAELGESENGPLTVYVSGTSLTATPIHESATQTLTVGSRRVALSKAGTPVTVSLPSGGGFTPVSLSVRDVRLETDGTFVFARSQAFAVMRGDEHVLDGTESNLDDFDYILANFLEVPKSGDWYAASHTIEDIPHGKTVSFLVIGDPSWGAAGRTLKVRDVSITFEGDPLTPANLWDLAKRFFQKQKAGLAQ